MNLPYYLICIENTTDSGLRVQVELTGIEKLLQPGESIVVNADKPRDELHIQIGEQSVIVWGGVDAKFVDEL